ncbi:regulator of chromosome condensation 1/beta-lactamase-inhibitor protein II, partial [Baffinella frigidus]
MNTTTLAIDSTSLADCVCDAGLYKDPYGFCVQCTPGSSSPIDGQGYDACTCGGGSYKNNDIYSTPGVSCGVVVVGGPDWTCVLFTDIGKVKCWGSNQYGQAGYGVLSGATNFGCSASQSTVNNLPWIDFGLNPMVVSVQMGGEHTCVLFANGKLKCFGANNNGQLGTSDTDSRYFDTYLKSTAANDFVDVGTGRTVVSVHTLSYSTCVLLDNQQTKCWGYGGMGQLGNGATSSLGRTANSMGNNLVVVDLGTNRHAVRLFPLGYSVCALLNTAELKCWGRNTYYQLGMGIASSNNIGDAPGEMGDNLIAIALPTGRTVIGLSGGEYHVAVIFDDHTMTAWGNPQDGTGAALGNIVGGPVGDQLTDMGNNLNIIDLGIGRKPVQVHTSAYSTTVLFDNGDVAAFGGNYKGLLGNGA